MAISIPPVPSTRSIHTSGREISVGSRTRRRATSFTTSVVDAAYAHYQATGSTKFLNIAKRYADCVVKEVGPKPGQATIVPGHQIAEMALARLYTLTGEKKYLDEAKYLLDYRGKTHIRNPYSQSQAPILEQKEAVGQAICMLVLPMWLP